MLGWGVRGVEEMGGAESTAWEDLPRQGNHASLQEVGHCWIDGPPVAAERAGAKPSCLLEKWVHDGLEDCRTGDALHSICQQIWKTQQWPQDWKRSVFIPVPKKGNPKLLKLPHNCTHLTL